jgi:hypothetical protein
MIIEKEGKALTLPEFETCTGAKWVPKLDFEALLLANLVKKGAKLHKKGELTLEQMWLGAYFKKDLLSDQLPDVAIRWINSTLGWGVFTVRPFKKMEFIAEYTGKVRKKRKEDEKNSYCFEYVIEQGGKSPYTIDARDQGGLSRYINHSETPNLSSSVATSGGISHVILYTKEAIAKDVQLCYHYGPDYWSKRSAPLPL